MGIDDGTITAVNKLLRGDRHLDLGEQIILPGAIDGAVRFDRPRRAKGSTVEGGTAAAAHGGVTTVIDLPDSTPPILSYEPLWDKNQYWRRRALVDFGSHAYATPYSFRPELLATAASFMVELRGAMPGPLLESDARFETTVSRMQDTGTPLTVHCGAVALRPSPGGTMDPRRYERAHPRATEATALERLLALRPRAPCTVTGLTTKESVRAVDRYNCEAGATLGVALTPHHLLMDCDRVRGPVWRTQPPLRPREVQAALFALFSQRVDIDVDISLVSDHSPLDADRLDDVSQQDEDTPLQVGFPGVETLLPILLSLVRRGRLTLPHLVATVARRPAERFGLQKGRIEVGYDADIIAVDFRRMEPLKPKQLRTDPPVSPFAALRSPVIFPTLTAAHGEVVMEDGNVEADFGSGRPIHERVR